jgi:hypothetical protein
VDDVVVDARLRQEHIQLHDRAHHQPRPGPRCSGHATLPSPSALMIFKTSTHRRARTRRVRRMRIPYACLAGEAAGHGVDRKRDVLAGRPQLLRHLRDAVLRPRNSQPVPDWPIFAI